MADTPNKYSFKGNSINDKNRGISIISIGQVVSITDDTDGGRIKVRIKGIDEQLSNANLPYALPMIPKFFNVLPNVGETVLIFNFTSNNKFENRLWVGPFISQPQKLKNDPYFYSSTSLFDGGVVEPEKAPSVIPEAKGIYPNKTDVALQGRDNTDIILKPNEIVLRAGKFVINNNLEFNKTNPTYIQLKFNVITKSGTNNSKEERGGVTNIVADKINLLSHNGNPRFNLTDQKSLITDEELNLILTKTHPLVYGDVLIDFINLVKTYISSHVHPYAGLPAVQTNNVKEILNFNLTNLVSQNIRIN